MEYSENKTYICNMDKKKEKKQELAPNAEVTAAPTQKQPAGFFVPLELMNLIVNYIGRGAYTEVNQLMVAIEKNVQPIFPKSQQNETENKTASIN